jgi:hypothetical protein
VLAALARTKLGEPVAPRHSSITRIFGTRPPATADMVLDQIVMDLPKPLASHWPENPQSRRASASPWRRHEPMRLTLYDHTINNASPATPCGCSRATAISDRRKDNREDPHQRDQRTTSRRLQAARLVSPSPRIICDIATWKVKEVGLAHQARMSGRGVLWFTMAERQTRPSVRRRRRPFKNERQFRHRVDRRHLEPGARLLARLAGLRRPNHQGGCYAEKIAARFSGPASRSKASPSARARRPMDRQAGAGRRHADLPLRWKKPRRIFVNSMSDLFHENLPDEAIDKVFAVMALAPQHTFQVLTKRPTGCGPTPRSRPFHFEWAKSLIEQCRDAGVACFMKQCGSNPKFNDQPYGLIDRKGGEPAEWPAYLGVREFPKVVA